MNVEVCMTRHGTTRLFADGQPVKCHEERLRDWVEMSIPRPWPPRIPLTAEQLEDLRLWVKYTL